MLRRTCLWLFVLLAPAFTLLASAAPLVDPLIGVRGTLSASQAITDPTLQAFGSCDAPLETIVGSLPAGALCAFYDTLEDNILSLDLQFFDDSETPSPFPVSLLFLAEESFFGTMVTVGPFTVRLEGGFAEGDPWPYTGLVIFTAAAGPDDVPASFVSVLAVNRRANTPEPAAMLLLGAGVVAAGARRWRRGRPRS